MHAVSLEVLAAQTRHSLFVAEPVMFHLTGKSGAFFRLLPQPAVGPNELETVMCKTLPCI